MLTMVPSSLLVALFFLAQHAFALQGTFISGLKNSAQHAGRMASSTQLRAEGTGGWGLGNSREMIPEEFAKRGDRKAFEGYKLTDRGEFMRQVSAAKDNIQNDELSELLGVAAAAGISMKDPKERLSKFDPELMDDDEGEDLDLSV